MCTFSKIHDILLKHDNIAISATKKRVNTAKMEFWLFEGQLRGVGLYVSYIAGVSKYEDSVMEH